MHFVLSRYILATFFFISLFTLSFVHAQTCYWPNGDEATEQIPCNKAAPHSSCCYSDSYCLDNGLCLDGYWSLLSAGSCTDKSYDSLTCFQYCKEPSWTWTDLVPNYNTTAFCCHFYENVSDTDDNLCVSNLPDDNTTRPVFIPANGHIITDRTTGATTMYNSTNPDNSTSTASSSNNGHASLGPDDHTGTEVAIGVGVGVPLALALCAALVVAGLERRKRVRERARWAEKGSTASAWMAGGPAYTPIREQQTVRPEGLAQGETVHELDGQAARHELSPVAGSEVTGSGMGSTGFANRYRSS